MFGISLQIWHKMYNDTMPNAILVILASFVRKRSIRASDPWCVSWLKLLTCGDPFVALFEIEKINNYDYMHVFRNSLKLDKTHLDVHRLGNTAWTAESIFAFALLGLLVNSTSSHLSIMHCRSPLNVAEHIFDSDIVSFVKNS